MDLSNLTSVFINLAGDAVVVFVGLALVDAVEGAVIAVRQGVFNAAYLPNFLKTNLGTYYAGVLFAAIVAASQTGGDIHQAALAVVSAGGFAMSAALVKDIIEKALVFVGRGSPAAKKKAAAKKAAISKVTQ